MKIELSSDVYNAIMREVDINIKSMRCDVKYIDQKDESINLYLNDFSIRRNKTIAMCFALIKILEPNAKGENEWHINKMVKGLYNILDEVYEMIDHLYY